MPNDMIHASGAHIYDKSPHRQGRRLSGFRTHRGISFVSADERTDAPGPEVFLDIDQARALRDWLNERIEERDAQD